MLTSAFSVSAAWRAPCLEPGICRDSGRGQNRHVGSRIASPLSIVANRRRQSGWNGACVTREACTDRFSPYRAAIDETREICRLDRRTVRASGENVAHCLGEAARRDTCASTPASDVRMVLEHSRHAGRCASYAHSRKSGADLIRPEAELGISASRQMVHPADTVTPAFRFPAPSAQAPENAHLEMPTASVHRTFQRNGPFLTPPKGPEIPHLCHSIDRMRQCGSAGPGIPANTHLLR
jgi:hypothetical protein